MAMTNDEFNTDLCIPHNSHESNACPNLPVLKAQMVRVILHHQLRPLPSLVAPASEATTPHRDRLDAAGLAPPFDDPEDFGEDLPPLTQCDIQGAGRTIHMVFYPKTMTASFDIQVSGSAG